MQKKFVDVDVKVPVELLGMSIEILGVLIEV
jgi:hypothetical protein